MYTDVPELNAETIERSYSAFRLRVIKAARRYPPHFLPLTALTLIFDPWFPRSTHAQRSLLIGNPPPARIRIVYPPPRTRTKKAR